MLFVSCQGQIDSLWFFLAQHDSPLGQDALAHNLPHIAQKHMVLKSLRSAYESLVSNSALVLYYWGLKLKYGTSFSTGAPIRH